MRPATAARGSKPGNRSNEVIAEREILTVSLG